MTKSWRKIFSMISWAGERPLMKPDEELNEEMREINKLIDSQPIIKIDEKKIISRQNEEKIRDYSPH